MVATTLPTDIGVVIVGAGLSGIDLAYCIQDKTAYGNDYAIFESRAEMGGTWSLFKYPGIRSDSDMYTLGFPFRPWLDAKAIADGNDIKTYIEDTAREFGIDKKIRYNTKVCSANWDSASSRWQIEAEVNGKPQKYTARFLIMAAGYYSYTDPHDPQMPGRDNFKGQVIHPQFWPEDLDYTGKKVVVIGSGATAVTLVPAMADKTAHITMLQRSPGYFLTLPKVDAFSQVIRFLFPTQLAHSFLRVWNAFRAYAFYNISKWAPKLVANVLRKLTKRELPKDLPLDPHFKPSYNPWDQRVCLIPDGDFFKSLREGKASIETAHIETFTENGIKLKNGKTLEADIIVTATGLKMQMMGGAGLSIDGKPIKRIGDRYVFKGQMVQGVPNLTIAIGFTNMSWTLGSHLSALWLVRLLNFMDKKGYTAATPTNLSGKALEDAPLLNLSSGYVQRAAQDGSLPKSATASPWKMRASWFGDFFNTHYGSLERDMKFTSAAKSK